MNGVWDSFLGTARPMPDGDGLLPKMQEKLAQFKVTTAGARPAVAVSDPAK